MSQKRAGNELRLNLGRPPTSHPTNVSLSTVFHGIPKLYRCIEVRHPCEGSTVRMLDGTRSVCILACMSEAYTTKAASCFPLQQFGGYPE